MMSGQLLDVDTLVARACKQTGLDDFGSLPYREGLAVLVETYAGNVRDPSGQTKCADRLVNLLATRLRCEEAFKRIPEAQEQVIEAPVFVTGLPRSGTSALINLLNAAPETRALLQWEIQFPDPWPDSVPGAEDPRYPYLVKALASSRNAEFQKMHYVDADTPEECVLLHALAFNGVQLGFEIMLEPYRSWVLEQDLQPMYAYQLRLMKMLNWRMPGQHWMLKAPAHMWGLNAILQEFPDARFVWCHRNPRQVVPSINSMNRMVMSMYAGDCSHLNVHEIGRSVMDWYAMSLEKGLAMRAELPTNLFMDCSQQEFVDQPMQLLDRIYGSFDLPLADASRAALQAHVDANPKGKHGKHEYDLASYGLSNELIDERFEFYTSDERWPLRD
jgi:hypothetical protein